MRTVRALAFVCAVTSSASSTATVIAQDHERPDQRVVELARAIDARLTVWKTPDGRVVHVSHCRHIRGGCRARLVTFARWMVQVGDEHGVDPFLLAAIAMRESGFDPFAHGAAGERGIVQLHPRGVGAHVRFVRSEAYRNYCKHQTGACQLEVLEAGARLVADSIAQCGGEAAGLGAYNSGVCGENAYARRVLAERQKLVELSRRSSEATASNQMFD